MPETTTLPTESKDESPDSLNPFWFGNGLGFLDKALESKGRQQDVSLRDRVIIVAGEAGTLKSRLSYGFLASGMTGDKSGAILFTSEGLQLDGLKAAFDDWGCDYGYAFESEKPSVLVRQVLPRFVSSSGFVFRLRTCIRAVKQRMELLDKPPTASWRLRIVIDNWNSIVDAHESLQRDRQLLHAVHKVLREEGVLALIVATQHGSPAYVPETERIHDVTDLEASRILTWRVNFFGDRRIAITTSLPSAQGKRSAVGELVRVDDKEFKVEILDNFDAYEDLELGTPRRVELKVRLYSGHDESVDNYKRGSSAYNHDVSALFGDLFSAHGSSQEVVTLENTSEYDAFKEYIQNLESGPRKETLVFQVDEFWTGKEMERGESNHSRH